MTTANLSEDRGMAGLKLTREEQRHPLFKKLIASMESELKLLREQNDHPSDIARTTLLRGEIRCVKRILALADEVGPESRQSEPAGPESAPSALAAQGFPLSFEK